MIILSKATTKLGTRTIYGAWAVMSVNTVFKFAILAVQTRIQTCEVGYGLQFFLSRLIVVLKAAFVTLGAGPTQIMVVAKFIV